jgi:hypothetical protein
VGVVGAGGYFGPWAQILHVTVRDFVYSLLLPVFSSLKLFHEL